LGGMGRRCTPRKVLEMKCELCHQAEAQTVIYKMIDGEKRELYVCTACAAKDAAAPKAKQPDADISEALRQAMGQVKSADGKDTLADMLKSGAVKDLLPALDRLFESFGIAGHTSHADRAAEPCCPVCGITRHEWRKAERLGCPACYKAFADELGAEILQDHRAAQHRGKAPERFRAAFERARREDELRAAFKEAVRAEDYERAATLREELAALQGPVGEGGGDVHAS
jgi:protein arginine kinase activator